MKHGRVLAVGALGAMLSACQVDEGPETRPVGEPILTAAQFREARTAVRFTEHVKPILEERCLYCHNAKELPGKYSVETRAQAMAGGSIVPGNAKESRFLLILTTGNHAATMPAVGSAPPKQEIEVLEHWINAGAEWPDGVTLKADQ